MFPVPLHFKAGAAAVSGLLAGDHPDQPIAGFDKSGGIPVYFRGFAESFPDLRERPFGRDFATKAAQPWFLAGNGDLGHLVGFLLGTVMLP